MYRNPNLRTFLTLRVIRIFPALVVEVGLAALILGPLMTTYPLGEYFTDRKFSHYFLNMVGYIHYLLPGVFLSNPEGGIVNSQLWTVPFELECYIAISIIALLGFFTHRSRVLPLFVAATLAIMVWNIMHHVRGAPAGGVDGRVQVLCFLAGVVVYAYRDLIPWKAGWAAAAIVAAIALIKIPHGAVYLMPICTAYFTVYLGMLNPKRSFIINSGDYSYGV